MQEYCIKYGKRDFLHFLQCKCVNNKKKLSNFAVIFVLVIKVEINYYEQSCDIGRDNASPFS